MPILKTGELWVKKPLSLTPTALSFAEDEIQLADVVEVAWTTAAHFKVSTSRQSFEIGAGSVEEALEWISSIQQNISYLRGASPLNPEAAQSQFPGEATKEEPVTATTTLLSYPFDRGTLVKEVSTIAEVDEKVAWLSSLHLPLPHDLHMAQRDAALPSMNSVISFGGVPVGAQNSTRTLRSKISDVQLFGAWAAENGIRSNSAESLECSRDFPTMFPRKGSADKIQAWTPHVGHQPSAQAWFEQRSVGELLSAAVADLLKARPKCPATYLAKTFTNHVEKQAVQQASNVPYESNQWHWYIYAAEQEVDNIEVKQGEEPDIPADLHRSFTSFVPNIVMRAIADGGISDNPVDLSPQAEMINPVIKTVKGVLAFADASGFTATTEALTMQPHGAEQLGAFLNEFFGDLIDIVHRWRGDIIKFSGDAITILWEIETEEQEMRAPLWAGCCCQEIHYNLSNYPTPVSSVVFNFHIGIGYGMCTLMEVGGVLGRFEYCCMGPPFHQIGIAEPTAASGETVASPEFMKEYDKACIGVSKKEDAESEVAGYKILGWINDADDCVPPAMPTLPDFNVKLIGKYIPRNSWQRIIALTSNSCEASSVGSDEEMRKVSVSFLSLQNLDVSTPAGAKKLQLLVTCCQRSCYALEGTVNKFLMDDKGVLLLTVFGLPPMSHFNDDAARATIAGMRMLQSIKEEGVVGRVGIATGIVWCGTLGNLTRREYTVMGNVVNLAARLMSNAPAGGMLCDQETQRHLVALHFEVRPLDPIKMKGRAEKVPVYYPTGRRLNCGHVLHSTMMMDALRGNTEEHKLSAAMKQSRFWMASRQTIQLRECVAQQSKEGGGVICIAGPAGTGKQELVKCLHTMRFGIAGIDSGFDLLHGHTLDPTETHTVKMLVWQQIFNQLGKLVLSDADLVEEARARTGLPCLDLTQVLQGLLCEESLKLLPLLSTMMPCIEFGHGVATAAKAFNERHSPSPRLINICLEILDLVSRQKPVVVLLHLQGSTGFFQHTDELVYQYAETLTEHIITKRRHVGGLPDPGSHVNGMSHMPTVDSRVSRGALVFVIVTGGRWRSLWGDIPEKADRMNALIEMEEFDRERTGEFFRYSLLSAAGRHVHLEFSLPEDVLDFIHSMTRGNASLIEIIATTIWNKGFVRLENGEYVFTVPPGDDSPNMSAFLRKQQFEGVLSIAMSSFDRLAEVQKVFVKEVAASSLDIWSLEQISQLTHLSVEHLSRPLQALVEQGWFVQIEADLLEDPAVKCYTFSALFYKLAAECLVLKSRCEALQEKREALGINNIEFKDKPAATPCWNDPGGSPPQR